MKWKIIADSGCDYRSLDNLAPDTEFVSVPLTIQVGETIYRDDAQLNIDQMMEEMYATTTASKSACCTACSVELTACSFKPCSNWRSMASS